MYKLTVTALFSFFYLIHLNAQTFEIRAVNEGNGFIGVQLRETSGTGSPTTSDKVIDLVFGLKWSQSCGNIDLKNTFSTSYNVIKSGTRSTNGGFYFQAFGADPVNFFIPSNWTTNTWVTVLSIQNTLNGTGTCDFHICEVDFDPTTDPSFGLNTSFYVPAINGFASNVPLPIDLTKIKALTTLTSIPILWETANEHNFSGFELQRSLDGAAFIKIAWIPGKGGQAGASYEYEDKDVRPGITYYYRLKMTDNDGSFKYSPVVSARLDGKGGEPKLYPNPSSGQVTLDWYASAVETLSVEVYSETGGRILSREFEVLEGANQLQLDLQDLPPGLYLLRAVSARQTFAGKIFRSR